uniref:Protein NDRG3 n=1 Tax=Scolopendra viridis TaxID=118503 RepID=A0A4D5R9Z9_SCOVI
MPSSSIHEETALLGSMPSDNMDDIELRNIQLQYPIPRTLSKDATSIVMQEDRVETTNGSTLLVAVQGDRSKPAIITYHDIGLNHTSCYQAFFNFVDNKILLQNFCVYHINAPGQEEGAANLPEGYEYPSMDQLADMIINVMEFYGLKRVIGFGVGAGGNILSRFALSYPEKIDALILVNCVSTKAGWIEWGYQKLNSSHLKTKGMTQSAMDYLMWHHFGKLTEERNHDLVQAYKQYFEKNVNAYNLALFIDSYIKRTDLGIIRELDPQKKKNARMIKCPVMMITGNSSPHVDDTVTMNGRLDPVNSNWMKLQDCGHVLEEQPAKVSEAIRLFLQGQGYAVMSRRRVSTCSAEVPSLSRAKLSMSRTQSVDEDYLANITRQEVRITENPINEDAVC